MSQRTELQRQNGTVTTASQALTEVRDQYRERLLNSVIAVARNHEDAEDITATAFAAGFKNLDRFRGESSLYTWIHAIAMNEARSRRRGQTVSLEAIDESDAFQIAEPDGLDGAFEQWQYCPRIWKALRQVPRIHRRVLIDRFVGGYSVREIAKCQRVPLGTVLSRLFKAKRLLRAAWEI